MCGIVAVLPAYDQHSGELTSVAQELTVALDVYVTPGATMALTGRPDEIVAVSSALRRLFDSAAALNTQVGLQMPTWDTDATERVQGLLRRSHYRPRGLLRVQARGDRRAAR